MVRFEHRTAALQEQRPPLIHRAALHNHVSLQVEAELIDKLDTLVSEGKGDENYRELFGLL